MDKRVLFYTIEELTGREDVRWLHVVIEGDKVVTRLIDVKLATALNKDELEAYIDSILPSVKKERKHKVKP